MSVRKKIKIGILIGSICLSLMGSLCVQASGTGSQADKVKQAQVEKRYFYTCASLIIGCGLLFTGIQRVEQRIQTKQD